MARAFFAAGDFARGNFYANQLDRMMLAKDINGRVYRTLPYTLNTSGSYEWVNPDTGFVSAAA